MPIGPLARPRGRHAAASRTSQPLLAGVLATALGGGTAALSSAGPAGAAAPAPAVLAVTATALPETTLADRAAVRASRTRPAPAPPVAAPAPASPAVAPPPPAAPEPDVLPGCDDGPTARYANGRIPASAMCTLPGRAGHRLRADAAEAFVRLTRAYQAERGRELCLTDSYRSYGAQVQLRAQKGRLAAVPGSSNHGTGIAVDLCGGVESFGASAHRWMRANAARFGWVLPTWARAGGRKPEPWHWEYRP